MAKVNHYHLLIIESAAEAALLPYLRDPGWVKPFLHGNHTHSPLAERLVCIAIAHRSFDEIHEALEIKVPFILKKLDLQLPIPYQIKMVTLPLNIIGMRIDFTHEQLAHAILTFLCEGFIQPITTQDSSSAGSPGLTTPSATPSPGHSFIHPSMLKIVPYR
jgi:hypothetical protein